MNTRILLAAMAATCLCTSALAAPCSERSKKVLEQGAASLRIPVLAVREGIPADERESCVTDLLGQFKASAAANAQAEALVWNNRLKELQAAVEAEQRLDPATRQLAATVAGDPLILLVSSSVSASVLQVASQQAADNLATSLRLRANDLIAAELAKRAPATPAMAALIQQRKYDELSALIKDSDWGQQLTRELAPIARDVEIVRKAIDPKSLKSAFEAPIKKTVEDLQRDVRKLSEAGQRYQREVGSALEAVEMGGRDIRKAIESLPKTLESGDLGRMVRSHQAIQHLMNGTFSIQDQRLLVAALLPGDVQRKGEVLLAASRTLNSEGARALQGNASSIVASAQAVVEVAKVLGVDPDAVGKVQDAVNLGNQVMNIGAAFAAGGPIGAFAAFAGGGGAGLMGGGGSSDAAAERRHAELMGKLDEIIAQNKKMIAMLEDIQRTQQEILQGIAELKVQIEATRVDLSNRIAEVKELSQFAAEGVEDLLKEKLTSCFDIYISARLPDYNYQPRVGYPTYERRAAHFDSYFRSQYTDCVTAWNSVLLSSQFIRYQPHKVLWLSKVDGEKWLNGFYRPTLDVVRLLWDGASDERDQQILSHAIALSATFPSDFIDGAAGKKIFKALPLRAAVVWHNREVDATAILENPVDIQYLEMFIDMHRLLLDSCHLLQDVDAPSKGLQEITKLSTRPACAKGKYRDSNLGLENAITATLAQRSIFSGALVAQRAAQLLLDTPLPLAERSSFASWSVDANRPCLANPDKVGNALYRYWMVTCAMRVNRVFATNVMTELGRLQMHRVGMHLVHYVAFYAQTSGSRLADGLKDDRFVLTKGGWTFSTFDDKGTHVAERMPTPFEVSTGLVAHYPEVNMLSRLAQDIVADRAQSSVMVDSQSETRTQLGRAAALGALRRVPR